MQKQNGRSKKVTTNAKSDTCVSFYNFSYGPAIKYSASSPCTNVPVKCDHCEKVVFRYSLRSHYASKHPLRKQPESGSNATLSVKELAAVAAKSK